MLKRIISICVFLLGMYSFSFAQDYSGPQEDIETILKNTQAFSDAYTSGDFESIANAYTKDGIILPPGSDIIKGREAIKKRWILPEGVKVTHHKVTPTEISVIGNYAHDIGYYEGTTNRKDGSEVSWKGKYIIIWQKIDKDWKIYADAWNQVN